MREGEDLDQAVPHRADSTSLRAAAVRNAPGLSRGVPAAFFSRALVLLGLLLALQNHALGQGAAFYVVAPCRVIDTRGPIDPFGAPALAAGAIRTFSLAPSPSFAGECGISPTAWAVSVNVTVTGSTAPGLLKLYAAGTAVPTASVINYSAGQTRANNAVVALGTGGGFSVSCAQASGTVNFIVDVNGYFDDPANNQPPSVTAGPDQTITLPASATLTGSAADDGKPSPPGALTILWSVLNGPGTVTFGTATSLSTTASFSEAGIYELQLTANDSQISNSDVLTVFVNPPLSANPQADATRLLEQATWGPTSTDIAHVQAIGMAAWLNEQFNLPASSYPSMALWPSSVPLTCDTNCQRDNYSMYLLQNRFFTNALYGRDQLRQRVAFALHELLVVSGTQIRQPSWMTPYLQIIDRNAFGNFRDLLYELTLNPAMGDWLDMATSTKFNPNENYAREIMQLFSVGVFKLNLDGTLQLDSFSNPIPTYGQPEVTALAHVFTGWHLNPPAVSGTPDYITPMPFVASNHDTASKTIINGTIIPAGQTGDQDLNQAIDALFNHPNVGPYLATQLIHSLVTSNPTPAYVARVASAFNDNGKGVRGDLQAVVEAILLDPEARGDVKSAPEYGHLKEPELFITNLLRAFNARSANLAAPSDGYLSPQTRSLSQDLFRPATVFSYYPADFLAPGTSLLGPEFGIFSANEALRKANVVNTLIFTGILVSVNSPAGTALDFTPYLSLASDPVQIVSQLNQLMMHGTMSASMQTSIVNAVNAVPLTNALLRVQTAVYLIATSSQYQVER